MRAKYIKENHEIRESDTFPAENSKNDKQRQICVGMTEALTIFINQHRKHNSGETFDRGR